MDQCCWGSTVQRCSHFKPPMKCNLGTIHLGKVCQYYGYNNSMCSQYEVGTVAGDIVHCCFLMVTHISVRSHLLLLSIALSSFFLHSPFLDFDCSHSFPLDPFHTLRYPPCIAVFCPPMQIFSILPDSISLPALQLKSYFTTQLCFTLGCGVRLPVSV